jgi:hypothetical protein
MEIVLVAVAVLVAAMAIEYVVELIGRKLCGKDGDE